ncbi:Actin, cytoplasmic [Mycena galopus ATCC 62051]|nr:Actin, cytoplasmic [Mycena galopus ATCC 62051]
MDHDAIALVFDNGSATSRAGFAGEDMPSCTFPSVIGRLRHPGFLPAGYPEKDCYVGDEVLAKRGILSTRYPIIDGFFHHYADMEAIWRHTYDTELRAMPEAHPLLLTEQPFNPRASQEQMGTILLEGLGVPAFWVGIGAVLALYTAGRTRQTGVVVDSGEGETRFVPVYEGIAVRHGMRRMDVAGRDVTDRVGRMLGERGYAMTKMSERELVRDMKERMCCVALDFQHEAGAEQTYELPDGQVISLGNERFVAPEVLFEPSLADSNSPGIHEWICKSIASCDVDLQQELYNNVLLSGGNTLFPGFSERLHKELSKLAPPGVTVKVHAPRERKHGAWIGGSILASMSTFRKMWISKQEYEEFGAGIVHRKFL